jgi:hypothetical protein
MSKIANEAYKFGLAPHHPYLLKKIAGVAMNAIKRKDKFIAGMIAEQSKVQNVEYTEEMCYQDFTDLHKHCETLSKHLWAFCKENELTKLP